MGKIYKGLIFGGQFSLALIESTDIVNKAISIHDLTPITAAALGRTLTITAFMGTQLKNEGESLSITINGDGKGGRIITSVDHALHVRGVIDHPDVDVVLNSKGKLDVPVVVGKTGSLTVVKNLGMKEPYVGKSRLVTGEIAEDFTAYFALSEQQPTAMALGVLMGKNGKCSGAGGIVLQTMPNCTEEAIAEAEKLITKFSDISMQIANHGIDGILDEYFPDLFYSISEPVYKCKCNKRYIDKVLLTLGEKELDSTIADLGKIEVDCEFCKKKYVYYKEDVDKLLRRKI